MQTYLSVVTPDVQASGRKVVFLDEFNSRHKTSDSDVVWAMLLKKYLKLIFILPILELYYTRNTISTG